MISSAASKGNPELSGLTVMLVEDEAVVALDIEDCFIAWGATLDGPWATLGDAMAAISERMPDVAVLDVMLGSEAVFPLADRLRDAGIPLIFQSGHADPAEIRARFPDAVLKVKPVSPHELALAVLTLKGA